MKSGKKKTANSTHTNGVTSNGADDKEPFVPQISRKIKACAACRRHKIKCLMDESGPPCRRCAERNLGCVLSKNLQSIIEEKSQYSEAIAQDLEHMHTALKELTKNAGLPDLPPLQSAALRDADGSPGADNVQVGHIRNGLGAHHDDYGPSCDNSPKISPEDEGLPYVPIHSLYALTKMRALRSPETIEAQRQKTVDDFITRGQLGLDTAQRLFGLYRDRLDPFMYGVGCKYKTLDELRKRSTILTAATLTVAALHDAQSDSIYGTCSTEFRRLMERSMFERRVDRDYLRAMCVASYWLSDMSWMLSGYAIRRAAECNLHGSHSRALAEQTEEAADSARLWYILYICDQHLATLYGRPSIVQEDSSIQGWDSFLDLPVATDEDKRLASQVTLLSIVRSVRELFGPDKGEAIPRVYINQINHFNRQLDQWIGHWSNTMNDTHHRIGAFPRKGALLHFHFAKLHLYSHVFRGLPGEQPVPHYFLECASMAIASATSIITFMRTDPDVAAAVNGIPSYLHSMTAFACMFLIKVAVKYGGDLIEKDRVYEMITGLVHQFRTLPTGKWHLANLMAGGLEKMVATLNPGLDGQMMQFPDGTTMRNMMVNSLGGGGAHAQAHLGDPAFGEIDTDAFFDYGMSFGLSPVFPFDPTTFALDGTGQVATAPMRDFTTVEYQQVGSNPGT
ncbi:uncharacterized protein F5Z01DRAFT_618106 [Emericellopsis atlantica]|uniref:Zn(2)-C6 fungal-type domain-containing protein n=1 Tax=Emericellopsis atlantica TaxID=2614577 RepID=A0A9P7ZQQ2_9HYPO|nr:uncharacterized protein F5Z01DRAFT_618106 [Emericellopsis atlantica]KAG9256553.1 hypothetical protein F5Z01DRAFT_618106 [Emericellopsis atlantica]